MDGLGGLGSRGLDDEDEDEVEDEDEFLETDSSSSPRGWCSGVGGMVVVVEDTVEAKIDVSTSVVTVIRGN